MRIKWLILIAVLTGTIAFWGCGGSNPSGPAAGSELEGTWIFTDSLFQLTFTFTGSNWTVLEGSDTWAGTFVLNTAVSPKYIDLLCSSSPDTSIIGLTSLGIYALNSTAAACTLATNDWGDTVRPIHFGTNYMVLIKQ